MKLKILLLCLPVLLLLLPVKIFSQTFPVDSLLFDGGYNKISYGNLCFCKVKVIKYHGAAFGSKIIKEVEELCGEKDTVIKLVRGLVNLGDDLYAGEEIYTLDGTMKIKLENGTEITLNPQTRIVIDENYCCGIGAHMKIYNGMICYDAGKATNSEHLVCLTKNGTMEIYHTLYTVEVTSEADIVRVYDGQVRVSLLHPPTLDNNDISDNMKQAAQDFQDGKISAQEFAKKMKEYNDQAKEVGSKQLPVTVDSGNKCIVTKNSLAVEPIESSDERWWEKIE